MNLAHLFEATMLVCFGFSWPINVVKAYRARTAKSTSLAFICLIITGYVAGIIAKLISHQFNYVLAVYFMNLAIVLANVGVYFRNKALDVENEKKSMNRFNVSRVMPQKENFTFTSVEDYDYIPRNVPSNIEKNYSITLLGGTFDRSIPVKQIENEFEFDFHILNKSNNGLSLRTAKDYFVKNIKDIDCEGAILHLGYEDQDLFKLNPSEFDSLYLGLVSTIKMVNKNCRIALVSIANPENRTLISEMNNHIKAIASSEQAVFIDLAYASLWNPKAVKASVDFAVTMGLNVKKPIFDVAKSIYSYAMQNITEDKMTENFAG